MGASACCLSSKSLCGLTDGYCPANAAVRNINITNRSVCMEVVGYLLEELRDAENFRSFKKDIQAANIFIGSLIFIEELAEKVSTKTPRGCIASSQTLRQQSPAPRCDILRGPRCNIWFAAPHDHEQTTEDRQLGCWDADHGAGQHL